MQVWVVRQPLVAEDYKVGTVVVAVYTFELVVVAQQLTVVCNRQQWAGMVGLVSAAVLVLRLEATVEGQEVQKRVRVLALVQQQSAEHSDIRNCRNIPMWL